MFGIKQTDSKVKYMNDVYYKQDKLPCNEKSIGRYGYSYRGTSLSQTTRKLFQNEYRQQLYIYSYTLTRQMFRFFFLDLVTINID